MQVEDYVGIVPVHVRTLSVVLASDSLDYGVLESQGCEVAVSDPPAVGDGFGDCKCLVRVDPVLPGECERVLVQVVG